VKLDQAIEDVQRAEGELAGELRKIGERHAVEHDLYHLGHTLARRCEAHLERLEPFAQRYGAPPGPDGAGDGSGLMETLRHKSSELLGRSELTGMLLLRDLRNLYLSAQEAELAWVILAQAAQAVRDRELLLVVSECHQEAEACGKWLRTRIKEASPQILAAG
jgi:hypothetical protein